MDDTCGEAHLVYLIETSYCDDQGSIDGIYTILEHAVKRYKDVITDKDTSTWISLYECKVDTSQRDPCQVILSQCTRECMQ